MGNDIGIGQYATSSPGIGGILKAAPEDFVVEEISDLPPPGGSLYTVAKVKSRNWESNRLVRQLSRELRVSRRRIFFAGTKDKRAVTTQLMEFQAPMEAVASIRIADVEISDLYMTNRRLEIGDLVGNRFRLNARDLACSDEEAKERTEAIHGQLMAMGGFPNFFGVQRFGAVRPVTHLVGKAMVNGDFERGVMLYLANPIEGEIPEALEARRRLEGERDFPLALRYFPKNLSFELAVINHLVKSPGDYTGALSALPFNLQMMFVHAYQAYLFNRALSERMRLGHAPNVPLVGDMVLTVDKKGLPDQERRIEVGTENVDLMARLCREGKAFVSGVLFGWKSLFASGIQGEIEERIVSDEGLEQDDFMIPAMRRMSSKGTRRALVSPYWEFSSNVVGGVAQFNFALPRGTYATVLMREFMKESREKIS